MKIFIGSSKESLSSAKQIAIIVEESGHNPLLWNMPGLFPPGRYTLESLENVCNNVDGAIFVFNEDDKIWYRNELKQSVRDNVLIEYGLFSGHLSRENVIFCRVGTARIATDLLGVTYIDYTMPNRANDEIEKWLTSIAAPSVKTRNIVNTIKEGFYSQPTTSNSEGKEGTYIKVKPSHTVVEADNLYHLSQEYLDYQEYKKALRMINEAISIDPDNYLYHNHKGIVLAYIVLFLKTGDFFQSNESFSKSLVLNPDFAYAYRNRALNNMRLKKYNESIEDYSRAIEINPNCSKYYRERSNVYTTLKDFKKAHNDSGKALELDDEEG